MSDHVVSGNLGSKHVLVACLSTSAAVALALWLMWPGRPRASREEVIAALLQLREECAAIYADIAWAVSLAALPPLECALDSAPRKVEEIDEEESEDDLDNKDDNETEDAKAVAALHHAVDQPLVLQGALREAAEHVAARLLPGCGPDDLEAELSHYGNVPEVKDVTRELRDMHKACLEGLVPGAPAPEACSGVDLWKPHEALEMLQELGRAKALRLRTLLSTINEGMYASQLGMPALRVCAEVENDVWERCWPGDPVRRCRFNSALEQLSARNSKFRDRRLTIEAELNDLAIGSGGNCANNAAGK